MRSDDRDEAPKGFMRKMEKEALFYEKTSGNNVTCFLCPHHCSVRAGGSGICRVRVNRDGSLVSLVYGMCAALNIDPIEKKPLYHFYPGSSALSMAAVGCNMRCEFCQNAELAHYDAVTRGVPGKQMLPEEIVGIAERNNSAIIAYTYTEPTVFFEYAYDTARFASDKNIKNVFVSNGYISSDAVAFIQPYLDGINVDLKSFSDDFYRRYTGARLSPVLDTLKFIANTDIWLEITTLLIPGLNDSDRELNAIAEFIASLSVNIPWHISRFYPHNKMLNRSATPAETINRAIDAGGRAGLRYIYPGNISISGAGNTVCPQCGCILIEREGYFTRVKKLKGGNCNVCGERIAGVWE